MFARFECRMALRSVSIPLSALYLVQVLLVQLISSFFVQDTATKIRKIITCQFSV